MAILATALFGRTEDALLSLSPHDFPLALLARRASRSLFLLSTLPPSLSLPSRRRALPPLSPPHAPAALLGAWDLTKSYIRSHTTDNYYQKGVLEIPGLWKSNPVWFRRWVKRGSKHINGNLEEIYVMLPGGDGGMGGGGKGIQESNGIFLSSPLTTSPPGLFSVSLSPTGLIRSPPQKSHRVQDKTISIPLCSTPPYSTLLLLFYSTLSRSTLLYHASFIQKHEKNRRVILGYFRVRFGVFEFALRFAFFGLALQKEDKKQLPGEKGRGGEVRLFF